MWRSLSRTYPFVSSVTSQLTSSSKKKVKSANRVDSGLEDEDGAEEPAPKKKSAPKKVKLDDDENPRKQIPNGIPRALDGIKVIYSGTMQLNRDTCKATAERYGATVVNKLEQADYIVLGANPGDKKLRDIRDKGLETIAEADFFKLLQTGVPREKCHRMALAAAAAADDEDSEPAPKKQKKK